MLACTLLRRRSGALGPRGPYQGSLGCSAPLFWKIEPARATRMMDASPAATKMRFLGHPCGLKAGPSHFYSVRPCTLLQRRPFTGVTIKQQPTPKMHRMSRRAPPDRHRTTKPAEALNDRHPMTYGGLLQTTSRRSALGTRAWVPWSPRGSWARSLGPCGALGWPPNGGLAGLL